jgi:hypothetical protein
VPEAEASRNLDRSLGNQERVGVRVIGGFGLVRDFLGVRAYRLAHRALVGRRTLDGGTPVMQGVEQTRRLTRPTHDRSQQQRDHELQPTTITMLVRRRHEPIDKLLRSKSKVNRNSPAPLMLRGMRDDTELERTYGAIDVGHVITDHSIRSA